MDPDRARVLLARRRAEREREAKRIASLDAAEQLRAWMYPKQRAFFTSAAKRKASRKTRRAGATTGGNRELLARALETPRFRAMYIGETRKEARDRAWESDTQGGLVDLLRKYGEPLEKGATEVFQLGGVEFEVRQQDLAIETSTGGKIELFGADDERALNKQRGNAKHLFWVDEAQSFRWLERFYKAVAVPGLDDFKLDHNGGEFWMTGTPDRDCAGMFYEATRDDGQPTLPGWEAHQFAAVDNPFFGATPEERWARTAEAARIENGWEPDDPDFLREYCGKWVKTDANFVYAVNSIPEHELCMEAPPRLDENGFPDIKTAMRDLPGGAEDPPRDYFLACGADLGSRDDFALVVYAWSLRDPVLYEVASWKRPGLDYDEMATFLVAVQRQANIGLMVADAGGGGKPAVAGWSKKWVARYGLPIVEATKQNKSIAIKQVNNDIRHRMLRLRRGSPLFKEMQVHRWSPRRSATGLMVEDASTPNHCSDAGLYAHRESFHHRYREQALPLLPGSAESRAREELELEDAAERGSDGDWTW